MTFMFALGSIRTPPPPRPSSLPLPATVPQCHCQPHHHWSPQHSSLPLAPPELLHHHPNLPLSLSLLAATLQCHWCPHAVEIDEVMIGIAPDARGSNSVGGGEAVGDEGVANGDGVAGSVFRSGIDQGEEEMRGTVKEHHGAVAGDVKGEGAIEDDALEMEAGGDAGGGGGKGDGADDEVLDGGVDGGDGVGGAIEGVIKEGLG